MTILFYIATYCSLYDESHSSAVKEPVAVQGRGKPQKKGRKVVENDSVGTSPPSSRQSRNHDSSTGSSANLRLARTWLNQCLEQHSEFKVKDPSATKTPLPTRLINVEQADRPFLEETNADTNGPYVALSYAWGEGKRVLTVKSNYRSHRRCLPVDILPQTFADAIHVTRALNYKYLWIDAFCIIQYDDKDLDRELPKMGNIYRYAEFTIFAEGAQSAHSGLFVDRDSRLYRPCEVSISTTTDEGSVTREVTLATTCNGPNYLKSRGWILQERVLSSRCLIFGQQMAWTCTMGEAQETRPVLQLRATPLKDSVICIIEKLRTFLCVPDTIAEAPRDPQHRSSYFDMWYALLEEYSDMELTFVMDNLKALSGLAALFHEASRATYVAGLWKEDLQFGLAWYVGLNDERPVSKEEDGPSWSWVSVGKVRIKFCSWRRTVGPLVGAGAEVLDTFCELNSTTNPYGPVSKGILILRAPLRRAILQYTARYATDRIEQCYGGPSAAFKGVAIREHPRYPALLLDLETKQPVAEAALDRPWHSRSGLGDLIADSDSVSTSRLEVWCLLLHIQHLRERHRGALLVLESSKTDYGIFSRLGLAFLDEVGIGWFGIGNGNSMEIGSSTMEGVVKERVQVM